MQFTRHKRKYFLGLAILCLTLFGAALLAKGADVSTGADREWARRITSLNKLEARIKDDAGKLQSAINAKNSGQGPLKPITQSYKDLVRSMNKYNHEKEVLKYKYPEEGEMIERRYLPMRPKPLTEYETGSGLNEELTELKDKISRTYAPFISEPPKATAEQIKKAHGMRVDSATKKNDVNGRLKLSY